MQCCVALFLFHAETQRRKDFSRPPSKVDGFGQAATRRRSVRYLHLFGDKK